MSINTKDIKILWAKAAGRCSMPDCRKKLVTESSDYVKSRNILIGDNCHIIGEKISSPRGASLLTIDERNRYPNLILLCRNHHKIVDDDTKLWPIEKLHLIKSDHEIWVEDSLTLSSDVNDEWYTNIINGITKSYLLENWESVSDHMLRGIVAENFIEGVRDVDLYLFKALFPEKYPELEIKIQNLNNRARSYVDHYSSNCKSDGSGFLRARKFYKEIFPNPNYHENIKEYVRWERTCTKLLFNLTHALNEYAEQVRCDLNSNYFRLHGKFVVFDMIGVLDEPLAPKSFIPGKYFDEEGIKQSIGNND